MNFETAKFQLNLTKRKIKGTSLFIHQAVKALLKQTEEKNREERNNTNEERIRKLIADIRQSENAFSTWYNATRQKFPHLQKLCDNACKLIYRIMTSDYTLRYTEYAIKDFWHELFEHVLQLSFIHPQFFIGNDYTMGRSIEILKDSWEDFIANHVVLDFEIPSLTSDDLELLDDDVPSPRKVADLTVRLP